MLNALSTVPRNIDHIAAHPQTLRIDNRAELIELLRGLHPNYTRKAIYDVRGRKVEVDSKQKTCSQPADYALDFLGWTVPPAEYVDIN